MADLYNIVFQIIPDNAPVENWEHSTIIKVLQNRKHNENVEPDLILLSQRYPGKLIRIARIPFDQSVSVEHANRFNGGYWQSR